ncbi:helix-turn-helix domain-containing protein [Parafrankia sp. EUN1f]|uniref:helix-turn-helix domain-containing protein n=1 Tax=Parafrankia sp. EUN1f TaxID=102897 RepID=UPI0012FCCE71|nr:helix-turn-helix transcriptional regulator [Parafrankia sp. EUN1f]
MELDEDQAQRLAAATRNRRRELRLTQQDVAQAGQLSLATLNRIENGKATSLSLRTLDGLDSGLRWQGRQGREMGSAERVVHGGSPLPAGSPRPVSQEFVDDLGVVRRRVTFEDPTEHVESPPKLSELAQRVADVSDADVTYYVLRRLLALEPAKRNNMLVAFARMLDAVDGN